MRKNCETCKHDRLKTEICDECYHTSDAPTKWEPATHYEPDTNAGRIRAMSDEELSVFLWGFEKEEIARTTEHALERRKITEWLKQPAE